MRYILLFLCIISSVISNDDVNYGFNSWFPNWNNFFNWNHLKEFFNKDTSTDFDSNFEEPPKLFFNEEHSKRDDVQLLTNLIINLEKSARNFQSPTNAREHQALLDDGIEDFGKYDFIIIGAGAAGSLMANRLSEHHQWKVLLIEAGDYGDNITNIPNMYFQVEFTKYNWGFTSTPQTTACQGMVGRRCALGRGKGVGGTTLINGLVYSRGSSIDFDRWAHQVRDQRWSYDTVLPYFKKTENFNHRDRNAPVYTPIHGKNGLLNVEYHLPRSPQLNAFLKANEELGFPVRDYNSGTGLGASPAQINTLNGRTQDTGTAFILPILDRPNLTVLTGSYATKVLFDDYKNARGVLFTKNNRYYKATALKEVIVSAGVFQSPQLLMLSGIGPRKHLEDFDIPVIQNLEVGSVLRDHGCYYGLNFGTNYTEPIRPLEEYVEEFLDGYGPLAAPGNNQGVAFYESQYTRGTGYPDIEIMFIPANATTDFSQNAFMLTDRTYEDVWRYINRSQSYVLYLVSLHSQSKGTVRLKSNDPFDYPLIDPRFLSDPDGRDIRTIYEAVQLSLRLASTKALQEIGVTLQGHPMRACRQFDFPSKDYWYCAIRQMSMDLYHPVGTCPMGVSPEKGSVVDSECRVFGVGGLRVVDASVFPFTLAGHPVAAILMVAEVISDVIKQTYLE